MSHTPGPWHWDSDPIKGDPLERVRYRVTAVGRTITQTYYSGGGTSMDDRAEADTRLIAAAPDLLAALKQAEHFLFDDSGTRIADEGIVLAVRAAIEKASLVNEGAKQ